MSENKVTEEKKEFPVKTVPVESRGGNDMASGAENWFEIEDRLSDERTLLAEMQPQLFSKHAPCFDRGRQNFPHIASKSA